MSKVGSVTLRRISVDYGEGRVVRDLSLSVGAGELVVMLGESGCGKSTTLRVVAGLIRPTAGSLYFGDSEVTGLPPWERDVGLVFQHHALFPHLSVQQNVAFGLRARRMDSKAIQKRVDSALELVRMTHLSSRRPGALSGGEAQRVALARAVATQPRVLLLDEPFSSLDARLREELREEVRQIIRHIGVTTILVTHDQEEALSMADRVAIMLGGRILEIDQPDVIYSRPQWAYTARFVGRSNVVSASWVGTPKTRVEGPDGNLVALKPEDIFLGESASPADVRRRGRLLSYGFHGAFIESLWRLEDTEGATLRVQCPKGQWNGYTVGEQAWIGWNVDQLIQVANESGMASEEDQ